MKIMYANPNQSTKLEIIRSLRMFPGITGFNLCQEISKVSGNAVYIALTKLTRDGLLTRVGYEIVQESKGKNAPPIKAARYALSDTGKAVAEYLSQNPQTPLDLLEICKLLDIRLPRKRPGRQPKQRREAA
jgi:DNA-binding transcriptional ArsR family regulator